MKVFDLSDATLCRFGTAFSLFLFSLVAGWSQFTPGNLVVLRLGDGTQTLTNSGNTVFVDQYQTDGQLVNSVRLPDSGPTALILSGAAGSEGGLTRSLDRTVMALGGYHTNRSAINGSLSGKSGSAVPRGIATVDADGIYDLVQTSKTVYSGNNIRGVATDGTNNFWTAGAPGGTCYFHPPLAPVTNQASISSTRYVRIADGNLFFSSQSGTPGLYTFEGGGLPETSAVTNLFLASGTGSEPAGFDINHSLTVAYVADQRTTAGGGVQRWTNNGTGWSLAYTFDVGTGIGAFAVAADFSGAAPVVYATTTEASANRLVCFVDTNSSATATLVATAGHQQVFKGVDFAPDLRPEIVVQPLSQGVSSGSAVSFTVMANSPFPLGYQWRKDGAEINGATDASFSLVGVTFADQGSYDVVVTNSHGAITSAGASLTIISMEVVLTIASQGADVLIYWPSSAPGYTLQGSSDLTQPVWSPVQAPVVVTNGLNTVTIPAVDQVQFYRLKQ
jgi:hypothetical protein